MFRWIRFMIVRRAFLALMLVCLGCSAQSAPSDINRLVERQVRAHYTLPAEVKVVIGALRPSDFANYDALTITFASPNKKQDFDFLLSRDHKTLVRMTKLDLTQDPYAETMKKIDIKDRPTRGNKDAKVVVVNYDDFECPFCSRMHQTIFPGIFKEYGDRVLFLYKDYPLEEIHPWALHAAVDANCLGSQSGDAYWDYADFLHANQALVSAEKKGEGQNVELDKLASLQAQKRGLDLPKLQACLKAQDEKAVRLSMHEGEALGVDATPAMFVNGQKLDGAVPAEEIRAALDDALRNAGVAPPEHKPDATETKAVPAPSK